MRTGLRWIAAGLVGLSLAGCRATPPGKAETRVMQWIKRDITVHGRNDRNPLRPTPDIVREGREAFGYYCTVCHGLDGQNTGVPFSAGLSPPAASLASRAVQSYSDGQLKWVIENGISPSGMPASRGILSDEEMWSIVVYLRHLPAAGSLGEPPFYAAEGQGEKSE